MQNDAYTAFPGSLGPKDHFYRGLVALDGGCPHQKVVLLSNAYQLYCILGRKQFDLGNVG